MIITDSLLPCFRKAQGSEAARGCPPAAVFYAHRI
jgi:hypothetical protein